jgi:serine/threonine protein kinase
VVEGWSAPFGSGNRRQTLCGTLDYLAPELVNGAYYNDAADRWCLGVLLYELLVGCPPFEDDNVKVTKVNIRDVMYDMPSFLSPGAQDIIDGVCIDTTQSCASPHTCSIQVYCMLRSACTDWFARMVVVVPIHSFCNSDRA